MIDKNKMSLYLFLCIWYFFTWDTILKARNLNIFEWVEEWIDSFVNLENWMFIKYDWDKILLIKSGKKFIEE